MDQSYTTLGIFCVIQPLLVGNSPQCIIELCFSSEEMDVQNNVVLLDKWENAPLSDLQGKTWMPSPISKPSNTMRIAFQTLTDMEKLNITHEGVLLKVGTMLYEYYRVKYLPPRMDRNCIFKVDGVTIVDKNNKGLLKGMDQKKMPKIWIKSNTLTSLQELLGNFQHFGCSILQNPQKTSYNVLQIVTIF